MGISMKAMTLNEIAARLDMSKSALVRGIRKLAIEPVSRVAGARGQMESLYAPADVARILVRYGHRDPLHHPPTASATAEALEMLADIRQRLDRLERVIKRGGKA